MDEIKNCTNCRNYIQHYTKSSSYNLCSVNCGHCAVKTLGKNQKMLFPNITDCKQWKPEPPAQDNYDSAL